MYFSTQNWKMEVSFKLKWVQVTSLIRTSMAITTSNREAWTRGMKHQGGYPRM